MRLPNTEYWDKHPVRCGAVEFRVVTSNQMLTHPSYPGMSIRGAMLPNEQLILVFDDESAPSKSTETFTHESLEAINNVYNLSLDHQTITTLGVALHQIYSEHGPALFGHSKSEEREYAYAA